MSVETRLYKELDKVLKNEGDGENAVLYGDDNKLYLVSKTPKGSVVVTGDSQENVVLPNGQQIIVKSS